MFIGTSVEAGHMFYDPVLPPNIFAHDVMEIDDEMLIDDEMTIDYSHSTGTS